MNAQTITTPALTTAEIEQRIADERGRLNAELGLQNRLQAQRLPALEAGDDDALALIEKNLGGCLERQSRIEERIEIFTDRLEQSKANDESTRLDEIAASAERSRLDAEKLIRSDYMKTAKAMAAILAKLRDSDELIERSNNILEKHKRPAIASANNIRCRPTEQFEWAERKLVTAGDPAHPDFPNAERMPDNGNLPPRYRDRETRELIQPVDADVHRSNMISGDFAEPLWQAITLPAIEPAPRAYVHTNGKQVMTPDKPAPIWQGEIKTGMFGT